ncbi:sensor histidine kinase [Roseivivax isoporae]|uniref:Oxygen sensor histidine kinase NreB n=1 Tax=Roseivivax isoporae LMG 25204 TaxID=1449351 RepID=X7F433_9RHOB|nr:ATP-binding protein [Roseivivax isoporae]ETX27493.1 hypothetical protein RISW2_13780 [Roseivivax isoporae LMG 25204]
MSLANRFALASGLVLVIASLAVGRYVNARIEDSVVRNTAIATALYMESFVSPLSQQLAEGDALSPNGRRALDEIFTNTPLGERVVSYKIWKPGGRVVEASDDALVGQVFEPGPGLRAAWAGTVSATFDELGDEEDAGESALGLPLLEIYSPIREVWSGEVIAVAEFYEINTQLRDDLVDARRAAWTLTAAVFFAVGALLYLIVLGGSRTIERQRRDLDAQYREMAVLSARNADLRLSVQRAAARASASAEAFLRRIGADLHDGPAQYLAFAALRLDDLKARQASAEARSELDGVSDAVAQAMAEIRAISRGAGLPDLARLGAGEVAEAAVAAHRERTQDAVHCDITCTHAPDLGPAERMCIFRFVQEGLNNASRHAAGQGLRVVMRCDAAGLTLSVADAGPGLPDGGECSGGLGLPGLRARVESLGGVFDARSGPAGGTEIVMRIPVGG